MAVFTDFSGRNIGSVVRFVQPTNLATLRNAVIQAENEGLAVHAIGSAWAFSAPGYCDGVIVDTRDLSNFPEWLQATVIQPGDPIRHLAAVESGIKVRDLYRALVGQRPDGRNVPMML